MRLQRVVEGHARTEKVECQVCGSVKELGLRCEDCGFPLISIDIMSDGRPLLFLPLCPSTNARMRPVRRGRHAQDILTDDARDYIASVGAELREMLPKLNLKPITTWTCVDVWTILARTSADCHNFGKVAFDSLEAGGLVWNDKYLLPRYRGIWHDGKSPAFIVKA